MQYKTQLHPLTHLIKASLGNVMFPFTGFPHEAGDLLVLNLHSTPQDATAGLRRLIEFLDRHFTLQSASFLETHYHATAPSKKSKPSVVFTFDDGLRNNMYAASLLEEYGIRGLFFVVPDFFLSAENEQEAYYRTHIRRIINPYYDKMPEDFRAMRKDDLLDLKSRGHIIGCHSMSHTMSSDDDVAKLHKEVIESGRLIDVLLNQKTEHFCAPFNSLLSVSAAGMKLIKLQYRFFHTTFPGSNLIGKDPMVVRRVNVESFWLTGAVKFACSKTEWKRWEQNLNNFISINNSV